VVVRGIWFTSLENQNLQRKKGWSGLLCPPCANPGCRNGEDEAGTYQTSPYPPSSPGKTGMMMKEMMGPRQVVIPVTRTVVPTRTVAAVVVGLAKN
jgi:hypothetical protein